MRRLILRTHQSPGDAVMLTAAVCDLHRAHPGRFATDVRTSADELWRGNPHLTPLAEGEAGVEVIDMHDPLIHQSNQRLDHFLHGRTQFFQQRLGPRPCPQSPRSARHQPQSHARLVGGEWRAGRHELY